MPPDVKSVSVTIERAYPLSTHIKGVLSTRVHVHRLSDMCAPTGSFFSFVRMAVDPKKPVLGRRVTTLWFALKRIPTTSQKFPCRCTPLDRGAVSKKFSFSIEIRLWAFNGIVDTKTTAANNPYVVALNPTHNLGLPLNQK